MPIYEYRCLSCGSRFDTLFRSYAETRPPRCAHCGGGEVARLVPRIARVTSDDARLDRLADPSAMGGVDERDPASVARWAKRLGHQMGEDVGDEFDQAMEGLAAGDATVENATPDQ